MPTPTTPTPTRARKPQVKSDWRPRFLEAFAQQGTIAMAARAAGVHRDTVYAERARNPEFAAELERADFDVGDRLESKAIEEALNGNDRLLALLLKARRPERYGDKLRQDQIDQIKLEARRETLAELGDEIALLTPEAREIVLAAFATLRTKELPRAG
jgi:hypothetical protein